MAIGHKNIDRKTQLNPIKNGAKNVIFLPFLAPFVRQK
jgi:hypothetical protein